MSWLRVHDGMRFAQHFKAGVTLTHTVYTIDRIFEDDKLDWDDTPTIMAFVAGEAVMWGGDFLDWRKAGKKPLYVIEAAVLLGGVASYAIGGREGLVTYTDIVTGKIGPGQWYDVVAPEVKKKFIKHVAQPLAREKMKKERELKLLGNFIWHTAERQLKRTGFNPRYPYII